MRAIPPWGVRGRGNDHLSESDPSREMSQQPKITHSAPLEDANLTQRATYSGSTDRTKYGYNDLGQLVAMADPDMGRWDYRRDFAGRLREQVDSQTNTIRFDYSDPLGRLRAKLVFNPQGVMVSSVTNYYDSSDDPNFTVYAGQVYKVTDAEGWTKHGYDLRGRAVKTARYLTKNGQTYTSQFSYDDQDRVVKTVYPSSGPTVTNVYDGGGNLSQVKQVGGSGTVYYAARGFTPVGQLVGVNFGNGTVTTNDYYPNSKRLRRIVTYKTGSTNIQNLAYSYDKVANVTNLTDGVFSGTNSATMSGITYDDLHRLKSLTRNGTNYTFNYAPIGNISNNGENGGSSYNYGSRMPHAVKQVGTRNYAYDANGNTVVRDGQRLDYDPENRLILVSTPSSVVSFGYDAAGARLWKQGTNTLQVWIGNHYEERNGRTLFHIMQGDRLVCTYDSTGTIVEYCHPDHLRSTTILTDQNGNRIQHHEYSAFGQERLTENAATFPVSRRYTGQVLDDETGLYYYGARYYDPYLGRFVQPDTTIENLFNPQAFNRYSYTLNNPLKYIDPTGYGTYWEDVGQVFTGYYDAGTGIVKGTVFVIAHPVVSAQGLGHAIAHPIQTGKAVANGIDQTWNSGFRGQGEVVGNVLFTIATVVAPAAEAGNLSKVGQVANASSKLEAAEAIGIRIRLNPSTGELGGINISGAKAFRGRMMNPNSIRFSQDSIRAGFKDPGFGTIDDLAAGLKSGTVKPESIQPIRLVEREGNLISIDNRRLEAFRRAGVDVPTRMATPSEIQQAIKQGKFSAGEQGKRTINVRGR